jgi:hypothetical protein
MNATPYGDYVFPAIFLWHCLDYFLWILSNGG